MVEVLPSHELSPAQLAALFQNIQPEHVARAHGWNLNPSIHFGAGRYTLQGDLDLEAFERAWDHVVGLNPILRAAFDWTDLSNPRQLFHDDVEVPLERYDWRGAPTDEAAANLDEVLGEHRRRPFVLDEPPLLRLILARLAADRHWFVVATHRLLLDESSVEAAVDDAFRAYGCLVRGAELDVAPRPPYNDFVDWTRARGLTDAEAFWSRNLEGFGARNVITRIMDADSTPGSYADRSSESIHFDAGSIRRLRRSAARNGISHEALLVGAWALLVGRYTGDEDLVVGIDADGRRVDVPGVERMLGPLATTFPIRVDADEDVRVRDWLERLDRQLDHAHSRAYVPEALIHEWSDVPAYEALFEQTLGIRPRRPARLAAPGLDCSVEPMPRRPILPVVVRLSEDSGGALTGELNYCTWLMEAATGARMRDHFETLAERLAAAPDARLREVSMLTERERRQILVEWNDTAEPYPDDACIHTLFEQRAAEAPDAAAITVGQESLSYAELDERATRWSRVLRAAGVGDEAIVGVHVQRTIELVPLLLGILKSGGAYLPLDPRYPSERLALMVDDAAPPVVVTDASEPPTWIPANARVLTVSEASELDVAEGPSRRPQPHSSNLAYVLYTSGSTGRPKGVAIEHRSAVNLLTWAHRTFDPDLSSVLATTSISFDCAIVEIFGPLTSGGRVVLAENALSFDATAAFGVRLVHTVPSVLAELLATRRLPDTIRTMLVGGEQLRPDLVAELRAKTNVTRVFNVYGPTETTTYATAALIGDSVPTPTPIGKPIANAEVYLLDRYGNPVPADVTGELFVGGHGVARGYLGSPERTEERFVRDPFSQNAHARLYRTGDLGRYRSDGEVVFVGRVDDQVKIHGHRVEPAEVERALLWHPDVREAYVTSVADGDRGSLLAAYVIPVAGAAPTTGELRGYLKGSLPDYMLPDFVVTLPKLPRTPNGKIDRRALPVRAPDRSLVGRSYEAPRDATEAALATAWQEILGLERVGVSDNFFELGGDSFLAIRMVSRAQELGLAATPTLFYEHPTIAGLAGAIAKAR